MATAVFLRLLRRASPSHIRYHHHRHRRIHSRPLPSSGKTMRSHPSSVEECASARAMEDSNGPHNYTGENHVLTSAKNYRKSMKKGLRGEYGRTLRNLDGRLEVSALSLDLKSSIEGRCLSFLKEGTEFLCASYLSLQWNSFRMSLAFARSFSSRSQSRNTGNKPVHGRPMHDGGDNGDSKKEAEIEHTKDNSDSEDDYEDEQIIEDDEEEEEDDEGDQESSQPKPAKKKPDKKYAKPTAHPIDQQGRVLNEDITADTVRLVIDGEGHRIISRKEALHYAKERNLDLVQVDGKSKPPVCKVFNFHKEEYRQEQIQKDRKKKKVEMLRLNDIKELRFTSKTERKDVKMKVDKAKTFMDRGHRVKFVAIFKGPDDEKKRAEQEKMINEIINMVEDTATIDQGPRIEARQAWVMLRHVKFGVAKKKAPQASKLQAVSQDVRPESAAINQDLAGPSNDVWEDAEDSKSQDRMRLFEEKPSEANTSLQSSAIPFHSPPAGSRYSPAPRFPPNTKDSGKGTQMVHSEGSVRSSPGFSQPSRLSSEDPLRSPPGFPQYPRFTEPSEASLRSPPKFLQSPRMSERETKRIPSEGLTRYPPHVTSAQQPEEKVESYDIIEERFSRPLQQSAESLQSVSGKSGYLNAPKLPQIPQGHGQGAPGLSSQGRGIGTPGLASQGRGQGAPGLSSQGRGIGASAQDSGHVAPGLSSQGRGQNLDSPLLDFFASPERTPQPSQGLSSSRVPRHVPSIGQMKYPSQGSSGKFDQGAEGYQQRKNLHQPNVEQNPPNSYGSRYAPEDDAKIGFEGHGRGSMAQGRGQGPLQRSGYPRYPSSPPHLRKPNSHPEVPGSEHLEDQHPPTRTMGRGGGRK